MAALEFTSRFRIWMCLMLASAFGVLVFGCASKVSETKAYRSYALGEQETAKVGGPMVVHEKGTVEKKRKWVGILNSPDGWETIGTQYSEGYQREELIYLGVADAKVKAVYRVFVAGNAMPEQQENLTFDISESNVICVKNFQLKVLGVDGNSIRYIVIDD